MKTTYYRCAGIFEDNEIRCFDARGNVFLVDESDFYAVFGASWAVRAEALKKYVTSSRYTGVGIAPHGVRLHTSLLGCKGVDHINGDPTDNRRANLRIATPQQNSFNTRKTANRKCKYKGVTEFWSKRQVLTFRARIRHNDKLIQLGHKFTTQEEAARAYDAAAKRLFGEFAWLNFPENDEVRTWPTNYTKTRSIK